MNDPQVRRIIHFEAAAITAAAFSAAAEFTDSRTGAVAGLVLMLAATIPLAGLIRRAGRA